MEGRLCGGYPDNSVCSPLPRRPGQLHDVEAALVADQRSDAVGALGDRVPVEGELVVLLDKDVERPVLGVPSVLDLSLAGGGRHVEQHL